jgi:hypothetical protein
MFYHLKALLRFIRAIRQMTRSPLANSASILRVRLTGGQERAMFTHNPVEMINHLRGVDPLCPVIANSTYAIRIGREKQFLVAKQRLAK